MSGSQAEAISEKECAAQKGEAIYEQIKALLEPTHFGQIVAIHLPTEDYFLGQTFLEAADLLRQKYPSPAYGEVYSRRVGHHAAIHVRTPLAAGTQK
jgi:hypothetical protein